MCVSRCLEFLFNMQQNSVWVGIILSLGAREREENAKNQNGTKEGLSESREAEEGDKGWGD